MWPGRSFWKEFGRNKLFDIGWSDISQCQACQMEEGTEKHRLHHCPEWHAVRRDIPERFKKWEHKAKTSKKEWKWQRGMVAHLLSESRWIYYEKERKSVKPRAGDAYVLVKKIGKNNMHGLVARGILVEVEHVRAHRTKKDKKNMSQIKKFVTEGNMKADDPWQKQER